MAFLSPAALLYHRQHCTLFFRNLTPGLEVVVQAVGKVLASTSSDPPSEWSGPVRYIPKVLPHKGPDDPGRSAFETEVTDNWGSFQPGESDEENTGESKPYAKRGKLKTSREKGQKGSSLPSFTQALLGRNKNKSTTTSNLISKVEVEQNGGQDITQLEMDSGEYLFGDPSSLKTQVEKTQVGKAKQQTTNKDPSTSARNYAMGLLSRGPRTELNLRRKMITRNVPSHIIDETINELQKCGLQSDKEYAELFARSRWTDNTWGPTRIKFELLRRGISKETVEAALVELFQIDDTIDGNLEKEEELGKWGMTTVAAQHLMKQARRRWGQGDLEIDIQRRRMIGWLQRRGFTWTIIQDILKTIESEQTSEASS